MAGIISRVESILDLASYRLALREAAKTPGDADRQAAIQRVIDDRRQSPPKGGTSSNLKLDLVLASRPKQYTRLMGDAAIVDQWSARMVAPCTCAPASHQTASELTRLGAAQQEIQILQRLVNTYRTITRTNTGSIIDIVV